MSALDRTRVHSIVLEQRRAQCVVLGSCAQGRTAGVRSSTHQSALDRTSVFVKIGPLRSTQCVWARA